MYKLQNGNVKLRLNTITTLKECNNVITYAELNDSKFLKTLAKDVFGMKCLAMSSVFGTCARNKTVVHEKLDTIKRKFMEGDLLSCVFK